MTLYEREQYDRAELWRAIRFALACTAAMAGALAVAVIR